MYYIYIHESIYIYMYLSIYLYIYIYIYICIYQSSAYELYDRTCMPLHMPKTLETCKKNMPGLIQKASRCAADRTSKTTLFFIFHFL